MTTEKYNTVFQRKRRNATPESKEEYNRQQREWRAKNPDKVKKYRETQMLRSAMKFITEHAEMFDYTPKKG